MADKNVTVTATLNYNSGTVTVTDNAGDIDVAKDDKLNLTVNLANGDTTNIGAAQWPAGNGSQAFIWNNDKKPSAANSPSYSRASATQVTYTETNDTSAHKTYHFEFKAQYKALSTDPNWLDVTTSDPTLVNKAT